jgi:hypothetical protein
MVIAAFSTLPGETELLLERIIGCALEVHRQLGLSRAHLRGGAVHRAESKWKQGANGSNLSITGFADDGHEASRHEVHDDHEGRGREAQEEFLRSSSCASCSSWLILRVIVATTAVSPRHTSGRHWMIDSDGVSNVQIR